MATPLVSVCIPAYKADPYIAETLNSVRGQTLSDWEIVVTEDGTKDRTEEIVREFSRTVVQPVTYNRHEKNLGLPSARNTGIAAARGRWVAFLDADDVWEPEHLKSLLACASANGADMAFSGHRFFQQKSRRVVNGDNPAAEHLRDLPNAVYGALFVIRPSAVLIERKALDRFGPVAVDFPHTNDTEYWLRILRGGGRISYTGTATCICRDHEASMSKRLGEFFEDNARLCERYGDWPAVSSRVRRTRSAMFYRFASRMLENEDRPKAYAFLVKAFRANPASLKTLLSFPRFFFKSRFRRIR